MPRVLSLDKSLSVLEAIFHHRDGIGTRPLAQQLKLNVATVHNIARTFCQRGYLRQDPTTKVFYPGIRLMLLGRHPSYLRSLSLSAAGIVDDVAKKLNESVLLATMDHGHILNLKYVPSRQALRAQESEDMSGHSYATAVGKVLLAALNPDELDAYLHETQLKAFTPATLSTPERLKAALVSVKEAGYATTIDEFCEGLSAIAVPIHDLWGTVVAGIGASAPSVRLNTPEQRERMLVALREAADEIEKQWKESNVPAARKKSPKSTTAPADAKSDLSVDESAEAAPSQPAS